MAFIWHLQPVSPNNLPSHIARCRRRGTVREIVSEVNPGCTRLEEGIGRQFASRPRTDEAVCVQQSMLRQQVNSIERFHRLHYCLLCDNKLAVGRNKPWNSASLLSTHHWRGSCGGTEFQTILDSCISPLQDFVNFKTEIGRKRCIELSVWIEWTYSR